MSHSGLLIISGLRSVTQTTGPKVEGRPWGLTHTDRRVSTWVYFDSCWRGKKGEKKAEITEYLMKCQICRGICSIVGKGVNFFKTEVIW